MLNLELRNSRHIGKTKGQENERIKNEKEKKEGQIGSSDIGEKIKLNEDYLYDD